MVMKKNISLKIQLFLMLLFSTLSLSSCKDKTVIVVETEDGGYSIPSKDELSDNIKPAKDGKGFRVFPTIAQNEKMFDKNNFPFIAEHADGFNLQYDSFGPFSEGQVQQIFDQFTNKNFIDHTEFKPSIPIENASTMNKRPADSNVTAFMVYSEAPAMSTEDWEFVMSQNAPYPLITHCRAYSSDDTQSNVELRKQILMSSGIMMEFQVTDKNKYDDAAELIKFCVDNNRLVAFLTTFQRTPDIYISAYKDFFYYLKKNLDRSYLKSENVIFIPNTYSDSQVFPETSGYGSTFGVAHWLIDQKSLLNDDYIQPEISFTNIKDQEYFPNHTNLEVKVNIKSENEIINTKLYINGTLVGEDASVPYEWSGGLLDDLTTGYKEMKVVAITDNGVETSKVIQIRILDDPNVVPGAFKPGDMVDCQLRNLPNTTNGSIRHCYGKEWVDYQLDVKHTGLYDVKVGLKVQRSKQFGGSIVLKKGNEELGRFTTILNDPDKPALPGFTEHPDVVIKDVFLEQGVQVIRAYFERPGGLIAPQFSLSDFKFSIQGGPEIILTSPQRNVAGGFDPFKAPANIKIAADVNSPRGGVIKEVKLTLNGKEVGTLHSAPYEWNADGNNSMLNSLKGGTYNVVITATDDLGYTSFKEYSLQVIERKPYSPDFTLPGTIKAWQYDLGGEGKAYHDFNEGHERGLGGSQNPRYAIAGDDDVEIEISAGDYCVSAIRHGEWLCYTISNIESGVYDVSLLASANTGKSADVKIWLDNELLTTVKTTETGKDFTVFKEFKITGVEIPEDLSNATIRLEFLNSKERTYLMFLRSFSFTKR